MNLQKVLLRWPPPSSDLQIRQIKLRLCKLHRCWPITWRGSSWDWSPAGIMRVRSKIKVNSVGKLSLEEQDGFLNPWEDDHWRCVCFLCFPSASAHVSVWCISVACSASAYCFPPHGVPQIGWLVSPRSPVSNVLACFHSLINLPADRSSWVSVRSSYFTPLLCLFLFN